MKLQCLMIAAVSLSASAPGAEALQTPKPTSAAVLPAPALQKDGWRSYFDGRTLDGWTKTDFRGGGSVKLVADFRETGPAYLVEAGTSLSGFHCLRKLPLVNYELTLEAYKVEGSDFFLGLTFSVEKSHATLVLGGWGGSVTGISSLDDSDASENMTTRYLDYVKDRWYKVRLKVTSKRIQAWLDEKPIVDVETEGRKVGLRPGPLSMQVPLGSRHIRRRRPTETCGSEK